MLCHFNSIKVRLEHKMREYSNFYAALFQFHKGTIRTNNLLKSKKLHVNFNSIKVRLEHNKLAVKLESNANFNSIKVRLEPKYPISSIESLKFQFHKGTIRTQSVKFQKLYFRLFQFHKGTIRTNKQLN